MDRGSNGVVAGNDVSVIAKHPDRTAYVSVIHNHEITSIYLVIACGVALNTSGEVILIMHQHACHGKNNTIHSSPQIEHYKNKVDDRSIKLGGGQHVDTLDKHKVTMSVRNTLNYMHMRQCTDN